MKACKKREAHWVYSNPIQYILLLEEILVQLSFKNLFKVCKVLDNSKWILQSDGRCLILWAPWWVTYMEILISILSIIV